ncbi:hypothetical protein SAMN06265365_1602 [Tistlia consotensis]|uniref:transcriptional regulator n=1 Tax=Tistlia consotensis TaxID=1321365 RepID=UPI000B707639|nr:transcriptional regulator [Tistlia consotensis]SNS38690.1 hypothetical protein SAMN06265365_1602 [Tistlia consotensis]
MSGAAIDRARSAWGEELPAWLLALARACDATSQARAAEAIGYSPAVVSTVLKGRYAGDLTRVEAAVRGAFMAEVVACPVLGEIPTQRCLAEQRKPFTPSNHERVRLYRACRSACPHSKIGGSHA